MHSWLTVDSQFMSFHKPWTNERKKNKKKKIGHATVNMNERQRQLRRQTTSGAFEKCILSWKLTVLDNGTNFLLNAS